MNPMVSNSTIMLPFMIGVDSEVKAIVSIGDAIMSLPIARENGFSLFLPNGFSADLIEPLTDVRIVRDFTPADKRVWPAKEVDDPASPYSIAKWGTEEFMAKHGRINVTQCWAAAAGLKLENPVPELKRPRPFEKGRVALFPSGSVPKRAMDQEMLDMLCGCIRKRGLEPLICPHFKAAERLTDFVASCEYAIGVYTGPTHLAASMGVKTIAIPLGDSPWPFRPLQRNAFVIVPPCDRCWLDRKNGARICGETPPDCIRAIRPKHVFEALDELAAGRGGIMEIQGGQP